MAVSVRIEDEAFSDRRYDVLALMLGLPDADCARGKMAALWRQCTQQQTHILRAEMVCSVLGPNGPDALVKSELGVAVEGGIRICGTKGRIEWLARLRKNGKKGGRPRKPTGNHLVLRNTESGKPGANPPAPAPAPAPAQIREDRNPAPPQSNLNQPTRKHRIPPDWQPRDEERQSASEKGLDCDAEASHFRDHHSAKGEPMLDWNAAFRTWLRNAVRFGNRSRQGTLPTGPQPSRQIEELKR